MKNTISKLIYVKQNLIQVNFNALIEYQYIIHYYILQEPIFIRKHYILKQRLG